MTITIRTDNPEVMAMALAWEMAQVKLTVESRIAAHTDKQFLDRDEESEIVLAEYRRSYEAIAAAYKKGRAHFKTG